MIKISLSASSNEHVNQMTTFWPDRRGDSRAIDPFDSAANELQDFVVRGEWVLCRLLLLQALNAQRLSEP
jgi:hypothetical protein